MVREYSGATGPGALLSAYGYDELGHRTTHTLGNGAVTAYGWDGDSRLTSLGLDLSGAGQDATWTLGYNPAGQVVSRALSNTAYAYTGQPSLDDAYANDGLNRVTAVDGVSVLYDANSNLINDGQTVWEYDASNRLIHGDHTGIDIGTYSYDPAGRLGRITATGVDSRLVYAGAQAIAEYDAAGAVIRRYVPGAGLDDYAAYTAGAGAGLTRSWPMLDPLGSVAAQVNGANVATQINAYDEYGVPQAGFSGRFGYAGAMFLERGVAAPWHMRNRQYNPTLGRFMQTDPIGYAGGMNLYAYVGGDPVNLVDPWGLDEVGPMVITGPRFPIPLWASGGVAFLNGGYGGLVFRREDVVDEVVVTASRQSRPRRRSRQYQRPFHLNPNTNPRCISVYNLLEDPLVRAYALQALELARTDERGREMGFWVLGNGSLTNPRGIQIIPMSDRRRRVGVARAPNLEGMSHVGPYTWRVWGHAHTLMGRDNPSQADLSWPSARPPAHWAGADIITLTQENGVYAGC